jgi:hypothetical protein
MKEGSSSLGAVRPSAESSYRPEAAALEAGSDRLTKTCARASGKERRPFRYVV